MSADPRAKKASAVSLLGPLASLAEFYAAEFLRVREKFEAVGDGCAVTRERTYLLDGVVRQLYQGLLASGLDGPEDFCLLALGGYGRQELFPYSDVDLLFLSANGRAGAACREPVAAISRTLWDLQLRLGSTSRTLAECGQLQRDNLEFNVALLDSRYLAGDARLFSRLRDDVIPHCVARDREDLVRDLIEMTRRRHAQYGQTIFHLEPNLKEAPGGLRDFHVARWLTLMVQLDSQGKWVVPEDLWPPRLREECLRAFEFLCATRCFAHYAHARDDNHLTYELQDQAAALGIGMTPGKMISAAEWMRHYFRQARAIDRLIARLLDESRPARASLYTAFQDWKSRTSNPDFAIVRGRIFPRQPAAVQNDPGLLLGLFEVMARHGLEPSQEAERWVEQSLLSVASRMAELPGLWSRFRQVLVAPYAAAALRAMHRLGVLVAVFPEFQAIDALVTRDFYHRYTVDEHSFMAIQQLEALRSAEKGWERRFSEVLAELEQPELLYLGLLFHDVGKGMAGTSHIEGSLKAFEAVAARLGLGSEECGKIRFLVAQHLEMSATFERRDVFDPETVRTFAENVGTPERLKMLTLLTYADIRAVNPEALTPWKAEMLWQLYVAASNYLARSVDDARVHVTPEATPRAQGILRLISPPPGPKELSAFLEGFPRRYLAAHSEEEIAGHFEMARRLAKEPVEVSLRNRDHFFELTVLAADRPFLFASITGTLTAWGMNIVKADAFANAAGTILDTFRFVDFFRTLELNPSEIDRFKACVVDVLSGRIDLATLMRGRVNERTVPRTKVKIPTQVRFDNASSTHSTLLELIAQDRPGLLYDVSSTLAEQGCNIEVALIDTEGQAVIDVFYLTSNGAKLDDERQQLIRVALLAKLGRTSPP